MLGTDFSHRHFVFANGEKKFKENRTSNKKNPNNFPQMAKKSLGNGAIFIFRSSKESTKLASKLDTYVVVKSAQQHNTINLNSDC